MELNENIDWRRTFFSLVQKHFHIISPSKAGSTFKLEIVALVAASDKLGRGEKLRGIFNIVIDDLFHR